MGAIKLNNYPQQQLRNAELARSVGVPARISILKYLYENERVTGPQLLTLLDLQQSTIHQHIDLLKNTGLIEGNFLGNEYAWSINPNCREEVDKLAWLFDF